jgi:hypothetical protein
MHGQQHDRAAVHLLQAVVEVAATSMTGEDQHNAFALALQDPCLCANSRQASNEMAMCRAMRPCKVIHSAGQRLPSLEAAEVIQQKVCSYQCQTPRTQVRGKLAASSLAHHYHLT